MLAHVYRDGEVMDLTIVIPVKNPLSLEDFIKSNIEVLKDNKVIVIDSGGGETLEPYCEKYFKQDLRMWEARKLGYAEVTTKFTLNLDSDTILPLEYVKEALEILKNDKAEAVAIDYEKLQGHYAFGTSIWKTEQLKKLYDYEINLVSDGKIVKVGSRTYSTLNNGWCECTYMWRKLKLSGGRLETLPFRAKHLK